MPPLNPTAPSRRWNGGCASSGRTFDAKDYVAPLAMMTEDAIETDDLAQGWLRGKGAIGEHFF